jgi:hypothetical protein
MIFYFKITKNIQFCTKRFQKNKFYGSFLFYFLYILLVGGNLVSKYEQLLILTDIDASTLVLVAKSCLVVIPKYILARSTTDLYGTFFIFRFFFLCNFIYILHIVFRLQWCSYGFSII